MPYTKKDIVKMNDKEFVQYLRDKEEIIEMINQYALCLDDRKWDLLKDLFTEDVQINFGGIERDGIEDFIDMIKDHLGGCGPSQHLFSNYRITVDGDKATAAFYGRVMHAGVGEQKDVLFDFWGEYMDELIRTPNGWRTCRRSQRPFNITGDISILKGA